MIFWHCLYCVCYSMPNKMRRACIVTGFRRRTSVGENCENLVGKTGRNHQMPQSRNGFMRFTGPCIVIYFYSETNQMHQCITFILFWNDTLHVSDGLSVHHQESNRYCCLLASNRTAVSVWQMPVAVCTVLNSWWWTERPPETCRVSFQNKINLMHWCIWLVFL